MYEESIRVPLILRGPGIRANGRVPIPVSVIDLVPTLLDILTATVPDELPGRSLMTMSSAGERGTAPVVSPVVIQENRGATWTPDARNHSTWEATEFSRAFVTADGWKYVWAGPFGEQLFCLRRDPWELEDLAGCPSHRDRLADMRRGLRDWQEQYCDPAPHCPV